MRMLPPYEALHSPAPMAELRRRYPTAPASVLRHAWLMPLLYQLTGWSLVGVALLGIGGDFGELPMVFAAAILPLLMAVLSLLGTLWCAVVTRNLSFYHRAVRSPLVHRNNSLRG